MRFEHIERLAGLGAVIMVTLATVSLLLRTDARGSSQPGPLLAGYPPELFPARLLTRSGPLAALAAAQARLLALYVHLPPHSDSAIWLRTFLVELREIMDTAYRVAVIAEIYGGLATLDRVVDEVRQLESELAQHVARRMLTREGDARDELLTGRLATLRLCVRELSAVAGQTEQSGSH